MSLKEKEFLNAWSGEQYTAFRKLQKTIDQARGLFDEQGYETELEDVIHRLLRFSILKHVLARISSFIGIWTPSPVPLSAYSFHATKSNWWRPNPIPVSPISVLDHNLWPLGQETWDSPEKLYANVKFFIDSQNYERTSIGP